MMITGVQGAHAAGSDGPGSTAAGVYTVAAHDAAASVCALILQ